MAQGGEKKWFGRTDAEYLNVTTLADLMRLGTQYGLQQSSLLNLNKVNCFKELKTHIATRNPQPTAAEISRDFGFPNPSAPRPPPPTRKTTQGNQERPHNANRERPHNASRERPHNASRERPHNASRGRPHKEAVVVARISLTKISQ